MTDREKLIDLLMQQHEKLCDECMRYPVSETAVFIADYLIANGVTFGKDTDVTGKWIPASAPPKVPKEYIVMIKGGAVATTLLFDGDCWFEEDKRRCRTYYAVTHWMQPPEPPKEG